MLVYISHFLLSNGKQNLLFGVSSYLELISTEVDQNPFSGDFKTLIASVLMQQTQIKGLISVE